MEEFTESKMGATEHEHNGDQPSPLFPLQRKKPRYRSGADFVAPTDTKRPVCNLVCLILRDLC